MAKRNTASEALPATDEVAQMRERAEGYQYDSERRNQWVAKKLEEAGQPDNEALRESLFALISGTPGNKGAVTNRELGRTLTQARLSAGLGRLDVAKRMDTFYSGVQRLEEGRSANPEWKYLQQYAEAVGCRLKVTLEAEDARHD